MFAFEKEEGGYQQEAGADLPARRLNQAARRSATPILVTSALALSARNFKSENPVSIHTGGDSGGPFQARHPH